MNFGLLPAKSWIFTIELFMLRLKSIIVIFVVNKYHIRIVKQDTKRLYMKESNFLTGNATIKQYQKEILLNTKGQYMKEFNFLVGNVIINKTIEQQSFLVCKCSNSLDVIITSIQSAIFCKNENMRVESRE